MSQLPVQVGAKERSRVSPQLKKCTLCSAASWAVGLATLVYGGLVIGGVTPGTGSCVAAGLLGVVGCGFLMYQPPLPSCRRCVAANRAAGWTPRNEVPK
jgi:hypothetical protein